MSIANSQLEEIYQETTSRFSGNPSIQISATEGTPPEKYEITYSLKGLHRDENNSPIEAESHTVTISIPFGFPHFPPSCTPNSPIFHPDFDPAAICIGDFWDQDKSLSDLIVYIGQLISGESFSTENAFNEEAATWYNENGERLPFDTLTVEPSSVSEESSAQTPEEPDMDDVLGAADDLELDVIDEKDLESDFDYLSMDDATSPDTPVQQSGASAQPESASEDVDHDLILLLKKKKRFNTLNKYLSELSETTQFDQRAALEKQVQDALTAAQALYGEAEEFEHLGKQRDALAKYREIVTLVSDFPAIEDDIDRTRQAVSLLGEIDEEPDEGLVEEAPPEPPQEEKGKKNVTFYEDEHSHKKMGAMPIAFGVAGVALLLTLTYFYFSISGQYAKAEELYLKCENFLGKNDFFQADKSCTEALSEANKIQFKDAEKQQLTSSINRILQSEKLKQGLTGNILYEGKYIPISVLDTIKLFKKHLDDANKAFISEEWETAKDNFTEALVIARSTKEIDKSLLPQIKNDRIVAIFNHSYQKGSLLTTQKQWSEASEQLDIASKALANLDRETQEQYRVEINKLFEEATYNSLVNKGNETFEAEDWKQSLEIYEDLLKKAPNYLKDNPKNKEIIDEKIVKANLYLTIESGKTAFTQGKWDEAIAMYDSAIGILNEDRAMHSKVSSAENTRKLSRIKLHASIIRDKQEAARQLKKRDYDSAIITLQAIVAAINESPFNKDEEFVAIISETNETIDSAETNKFVGEKISYLEENFRSIFLQSYPTATEESLQDPKVKFVKKIDKKLLFKLECVEKGRGRPFRLVIDYLYDPAQDRWSFYSP